MSFVLMAMLAALLTAPHGGGEGSMPIAPATVDTIRPRLEVGTFLTTEDLGRLEPELARHWSGLGDAVVLRDLTGPPLREGVRLFTIRPAQSERRYYALGFEDGPRVELLYFDRILPPEPGEEPRGVCGGQMAEAQLTVTRELLDRELSLCSLPAERNARLYSYLATQLEPWGSPYGLLLSPEELGSPREKWVPADARNELRAFAEVPKYRPYRFQDDDSCLLEFRTWDGLGVVTEWRVVVGHRHVLQMSAIQLPIRPGTLTRSMKPQALFVNRPGFYGMSPAGTVGFPSW